MQRLRPDALTAAAQELRLIVTIAPNAIDELCASLSRLSDELHGLARDVGLDDPATRPMLDLRTRFDSYVLAARTLDEAQPGSTRVVALLRRAVDQTIDELDPSRGRTSVPVSGVDAAMS